MVVAALVLSISHVASVAVMYLGLRRAFHAPILIAAGFATMLAAGVGYHYINSEFSAPFYGLFALLTWYVGQLCILYGVTWKRALWFAVLGLITGLIRPDGVIFAALMLCGTMYGVRENRGTLLVSFVAIFGVLGGIYFAWRLHYFGYPLPIPFYAKHESSLNWSNAKVSARNIISMLLPLLPLAGLGLINKKLTRLLIAWLIAIIPFTLVWMVISLDNNHFSRFQYVMVPMSILTLGGLLSESWRQVSEDYPRQIESLKKPLVAAVGMLFACAIIYNLRLYDIPYSNVGAVELADRLRPYASKNYTMVVTEAGDLPLRSEWKAIDTFGFNDAFIARNKGLLTEEYLDRYQPEIIMYRVMASFHTVGELQSQVLGVPPPAGTDNNLTLNDVVMHAYAKKHNYVLAAVWGGQYCDYHVFWVRSGMRDSDAIVSAIRDHPYYMQLTGQLSYDFRGAAVPTVPCNLNARS